MHTFYSSNLRDGDSVGWQVPGFGRRVMGERMKFMNSFCELVKI